MKTKNVYIELICSDCLQELVNAEPREDEKFSRNMRTTLSKWAKNNYVPAGLTENMEGGFSWGPCILCGDLPGTRYEYNFLSEVK